MSVRILFIAICCGFGLFTLNAQTTEIAHAEISFEFVSKGVTGSISGFESESKIDLEHPENSVFKGRVASKTIDTNNGLRNWSLRSRKYFDVDDYPFISFESSKITQQSGEIVAQGKLKIKATSKPVTIRFVRKGNKLLGTFSLNSMDYGIKIKKKREDNLVKVWLELGVE